MIYPKMSFGLTFSPILLEKQPQDHSLDSYLAKNTSEDNASFNDMMVENEKKHRQKHAWLYENEVSLEQVGVIKE